MSQEAVSKDVVPTRTHTLACRSDEEITIVEYETSHENLQGLVLITPAMGVRQHYYRYLASFFTQQGYKVYSMDYSGIGFSKSRPIRQYRSTIIQDWMFEVEDVVEWVLSRHDTDLPFYYVCHSLGGQIFGLLSNNHKITAMISITSQNGYYKYYLKWQGRYFFFWHMVVPPITKLLGYFPSSWFNLGEPLPKRMGLSWKRWCTSEDYFFSDPSVPEVSNFSKFQGPILTLSFTDDLWATEPAVQSLVTHYSEATINHWHKDPADVGLSSIGHLGFFRPKCSHLWPDLVSWMQEHH